MKIYRKNNRFPADLSSCRPQDVTAERFTNDRRTFLKKGILLSTVAGISGIGLLSGCKEETEEEVTPSEDLMREHGVLNRILLIYDTCSGYLQNNLPFDLKILHNSAQIIRTFIEDYHEKLEQDYLFPRFEQANQFVDLIKVLRAQHQAGRVLTDRILYQANMKPTSNTEDNQKLSKLLNDFSGMYRPHEAREDTVLFPTIRKIVSKDEYYALGEDFERREHELFGEDGFDSMVEKVAALEKQLGIYELSQFTPTIV
ncbi:MAG: hemerythrin domain-containing protein [Dysgonomonadaceae bacterium]|jgi:hemerythrin-like domain-containing protein|nr:hemerythrin domain-containing protein [Dysgonamonadaceae bacterium]HOV35816.1 hemerythrin domain-containing protein [Dysgonamonadaceae bacterium]HQG08819.1 hemerythrin domain-containing protein [Dysgonamonadaceae bacterium]HQI42577.1 hemerythrin domain-containing protein [Dysgonamonadaceae bacterium]HRS41769.1 hemerythrin domain-containing protein [Dysgonamonadaceae bacterium]